MHCTQCGAPGEGTFCGSCGATLTERDCPSCARPSPRGRRFCTSCGSGLGTVAPGAARAPGDRSAPRPAGADGSAGWWVSGVLLVVLLVGGGWALLSDDRSSGAAASGFPGGAAGGGMEALGPAPHIDLASMTRREAADALFDRVMNALSRGDDAEVVSFLPMAIGAYEWARPLDQDGLFHLSLLHGIGSDFASALDAAEEGLAESPEHLLNLAAAAQAARGLGDMEGAGGYYRRLLEAWERETARDDRPGYVEHAPLLPELRREAEEFLEGGGS
jgi:hypothetical protein